MNFLFTSKRNQLNQKLVINCQMSPVIIFWLNTLKGTAKSTLKHPNSYQNRFFLLLKGTISTPVLFIWEPSALWTLPTG